MSFPEQALPTPRYKLFSPGNVGVATFLGSMLAGSILLALNYRRLGRGGAALVSVGTGAAVTTAMIVLAFVVPESPNKIWTIVNFLLALFMKQVTEVAQSRELQAHRAAGGKVGAGWATAGISVACVCVALIAIVTVETVSEPDLGDSVSSGNQTVYYKDGVSYAEARAVLEVLHDEGYFSNDDAVADVQVVRRGGTPHIVFVVVDPRATGETEDAFRQLGRALSEGVFAGGPVVIELADDALQIGKRIPIE